MNKEQIKSLIDNAALKLLELQQLYETIEQNDSNSLEDAPSKPKSTIKALEGGIAHKEPLSPDYYPTPGRIILVEYPLGRPGYTEENHTLYFDELRYKRYPALVIASHNETRNSIICKVITEGEDWVEFTLFHRDLLSPSEKESKMPYWIWPSQADHTPKKFKEGDGSC